MKYKSKLPEIVEAERFVWPKEKPFESGHMFMLWPVEQDAGGNVLVEVTDSIGNSQYASNGDWVVVGFHNISVMNDCDFKLKYESMHDSDVRAEAQKAGIEIIRDPQIPKERPPCPACPHDVRNLHACAHNLVVLLKAGDAERMRCKLNEKVSALQEAVNDFQPVVDRHFKECDVDYFKKETDTDWQNYVPLELGDMPKGVDFWFRRGPEFNGQKADSMNSEGVTLQPAFRFVSWYDLMMNGWEWSRTKKQTLWQRCRKPKR